MKKRTYLERLIDYMQGKYIIQVNNIDYDNKEIEILSDINKQIKLNNKEVTIDFQKQNNSLILVYKKSLNNKFISIIKEDINNTLNIVEFARYRFRDFLDFEIIHWVLDKQKLNRMLLEDLEKNNQIIDLKFII